MKIVIAPDSFKGSLSAVDFCRIVKLSALEIFPEAEIIEVPIADGGEGTVEAFVLATGGDIKRLSVLDPLGREIEAGYGVLGDGKTAIVEIAQAIGLPLLKEDERNPLEASSFGAGQILEHIFQEKFSKIIIGIGGSATNDGGAGLLEALGVKIYDKQDELIKRGGGSLIDVKNIDLSKMKRARANTEITVLCDVKNLLLGDQGATYVYGPQKGATLEMLETLEKGMKNYVEKLEKALDKKVGDMKGTGAAGGIGAALYGALNAELVPGIDAVLDAVDFDEKIKDVDIVITGEGRIDAQSILYEKVPAGVGKRCAKAGIPMVVFVGSMGPGAEDLYKIVDSSIMTTVNEVMDISYAMKNAEALLKSSSERAFRLIKMGGKISR